MTESEKFGFKELVVWRKSLDFAQAVIRITEHLNTDRNHFRLIEQVESSAASVSMNIAEGKGRFSKKEFLHFLYIARGSIYETVTLLNLFHRLSWIDETSLGELEKGAAELGRMLDGLINSIKSKEN